MSTTSTKSHRKNRKENSRTKDMRAKQTDTTGAPAYSADISERAWRLSSLGILIVGAFLRLYNLSLVPLHHDEGVNGNFLVTLVREGQYTYNPENYHGPTLYYFSAIIPWLCRFFGGKVFGSTYGLTTFNIRFVTAAFGVATIWLVLLLRKRLGTIGALAAAGLIAISPGGVYLSRYFIHESLFVFFTLAIVVAALKYYDTGQAVYLILAAISAALMVATKETWVMNGPVLLIALILTQDYLWLRTMLQGRVKQILFSLTGRIDRRTFWVISINIILASLVIWFLIVKTSAAIGVSQSVKSISDYVLSLAAMAWIGMAIQVKRWHDIGRSGWMALIGFIPIVGPVIALVYLGFVRGTAGTNEYGDVSRSNPLSDRLGDTITRLGGPVPLATVALVAFTVFILVNVLFYSSFFTNYPKGVSDSLQALKLWRHRTHEHAHPFLQYFEWLRQIESPLLLLGAVGSAIAVWRGDNRFALFAAQWAFGLLVAYSLVEYKTPWIALNFIVPLAIVGGYALDQLYQRFGQPSLPLAMIAGAIVLLVFGRLAKLKDGDASVVSRLTWDFDPATQWPAMIAILLLSAYAGYVLYARTERQKHALNFYLAAAVALCVLGYQMYQVNAVHYDDDQYPYVYAHTKRETLTLIDQIESIAKRLGTGTDTGIALVSPDYWPLPWYFRDYKKVGYYQQIVPTTEPIIIGSMAQEEQLKTTYGDRYVLVPSSADEGAYALRPGVDLLLYVRKDVAR